MAANEERTATVLYWVGMVTIGAMAASRVPAEIRVFVALLGGGLVYLAGGIEGMRR
jgi:hypothetical protein